MVLGVCGPLSAAPADGKSNGEVTFSQGETAVREGRLLDAADRFAEAAAAFGRSKRPRSQATALYNLAVAYQQIGNQKLAFAAIDEGITIARKTGDADLEAQLSELLGSVSTFTRKAELAEEELTKARKRAEESGDRKGLAVFLNDYGVMRAGQGQHEEAGAAFAECVALAGELNMVELAAKAELNAALMNVNLASEEDGSGAGEAAMELLARAQEHAATLPASRAKAWLLLGIGTAWRGLLDAPQMRQRDFLGDAFTAYRSALEVATGIKDPLAVSYACGWLGRLYEMRGRLDEALDLSRRARALAAEQGSEDVLYQWEWQCGRILAAQPGAETEALKAYVRAKSSLEKIRHDVAIGYGNRNLGGSFREAVGSLYFEMAALLLNGAGGDASDEASQAIFRQARDVVESFKSAELEDYFQDECINLALAKQKGVEAVSPEAAIFYIIPLADRTEILVEIGGVIHRFRSPHPAEEINDLAGTFRRNLERRGNYLFMEQGQALYDALIAPAAALLEQSGVTTLVFVPDGGLRTIPMGALHDGEKFLVQKYAIAVTPGMRLMDPKPIPRHEAHLLVGALTGGVQNFPALEYVASEVKGITDRIPSDVLEDADFKKAPFTVAVSSGHQQLVHIASHGEFSGDSKKTFLLTYDSKINLDELEQMIRPRQFAGTPVELLCLSACKTAAGDDRAAMGLAGIAVKSGARSALATLWYVNDEVSSQVLQTFYKLLQENPEISKAEALRQGQLELIGDIRYQHPCYWAPYLIIGNWL